jgi:hypothetical protein
MTLADHDQPKSDSLAWEVFSIFFWVLTFLILFFTTIWPSNPLLLQKVESWLLLISITSTVLYSYGFIFLRNIGSLTHKTWIFVGILMAIGLYLSFILATLLWRDAKSNTSTALSSAMATFDYIPACILQFTYQHHAVVVIFLLTIIDGIIAYFHESPYSRSRFVRLILNIDVPTLIALCTVAILRSRWSETWGGPINGIRFEAGAITFQLLAANISILLGNLLYRCQQQPTLYRWQQQPIAVPAGVGGVPPSSPPEIPHSRRRSRKRKAANPKGGGHA